MGLLKSALKTGIVVKVVDVVRREMSKPENQRKAKELAEKVRREMSKPENQRKAKEMLGKVTNRTGKKRSF